MFGNCVQFFTWRLTGVAEYPSDIQLVTKVWLQAAYDRSSSLQE